ncbi:MAG: hypothetical protein ACK6CU_22180 [Deltaproteobacteria bacterium]|jgi:hypothetical protein
MSGGGWVLRGSTVKLATAGWRDADSKPDGASAWRGPARDVALRA